MLDLGAGTGRDVYICSKLVGKEGKVIGIDMTEEQVSIAKDFQGYHAEKFGFENTEFVQGYIEDFVDQGIFEEGTADVVISNCVVNLCPDKPKVLRQIWKALKEGGELYFSDMYADRRIPEEIQKDPLLWSKGFGGSLFYSDFQEIMKEIGFKDVRIVAFKELNDPYCENLKPNYYSITVRAFKISDFEEKNQDYGNLATYKGGIVDFEDALKFDMSYTFERDTPVAICQNTKKILEGSRYAKYFEISEDGLHLGLHQTQSFRVPVKSQCSKN